MRTGLYFESSHLDCVVLKSSPVLVVGFEILHNSYCGNETCPKVYLMALYDQTCFAPYSWSTTGRWQVIAWNFLLGIIMQVFGKRSHFDRHLKRRLYA